MKLGEDEACSGGGAAHCPCGRRLRLRLPCPCSCPDRRSRPRTRRAPVRQLRHCVRYGCACAAPGFLPCPCTRCIRRARVWGIGGRRSGTGAAQLRPHPWRQACGWGNRYASGWDQEEEGRTQEAHKCWRAYREEQLTRKATAQADRCRWRHFVQRRNATVPSAGSAKKKKGPFFSRESRLERRRDREWPLAGAEAGSAWASRLPVGPSKSFWAEIWGSSGPASGRWRLTKRVCSNSKSLSKFRVL